MARQSKTMKLEVRITPQQNALLKQVAAERGLSVSEHVRRVVLSEGVRAGLFSSTGHLEEVA